MFRPLQYFLPSSLRPPQHFCSSQHLADQSDILVTPPDYTPAMLISPSGAQLRALVQITKNAIPDTLGNNEAIATTGDAYTNMGILKFIMDHLHSVKNELGYDDDKTYACAAFLHGRLASNDILARIYHKQGYNNPDELAISSEDCEEYHAWLDGKMEGDAPKVLADLFKANVWLAFTMYRFPALYDYMKSLFLPLVPVAIGMFEDAYKDKYDLDNPDHGADNYFLERIHSDRETDAAKLDPKLTGRLLEHLSKVPVELKASKVGDLARCLANGPPVQFDSEGRIQGIHKHLQLEGHTTLCFFLAQGHDRLYPLHRSIASKAAQFQTLLLDLASSDVCLHHFMPALGMEAMPKATPGEASRPLSLRSAAEVFVASIALLESKSPDQAFKQMMDELSVLLVNCAFATLKDFEMVPQPLVPAGNEQFTSTSAEPLLLFSPPHGLKMDQFQTFIASPGHNPAIVTVPFAELFGPLIQITKNAIPNTLGNNESVATTGGAYTNMGILKVIMDHLKSVREELGYDDDKMYACAAYLYGRLASNDTLARIYYEQGHKNPDELATTPEDRQECRTWIAGNLEGNAPNVLADLFKANAWLINITDLGSGLFDHLKSIFLPLIPIAIGMFEDAYQDAYKRENSEHGASNYFLERIHSDRVADASKLDPKLTGRLLKRLDEVPVEVKASRVGDLARSLANGPSVQFDSEGWIQGIHKHLQLEGYTTLCFFLAQCHDQLYPLHRSIPSKAAQFQTLLLGLASSDVCLHHLAIASGMKAVAKASSPPSEAPRSLSPRSAAEVFVASIALLHAGSKDVEPLDEVMHPLSMMLVQCAFNTLEDLGMAAQPLLPAGEGQVNTLPREKTERPIKTLPRNSRRSNNVPTNDSGND
ncbi:hypothetical protein EYR40_010397 [Pleurotus pulmonarius]|nr:hypothetical protein EYR40_010397 [Pleurotus pulmonarius]